MRAIAARTGGRAQWGFSAELTAWLSRTSPAMPRPGLSPVSGRLDSRRHRVLSQTPGWSLDAFGAAVQRAGSRGRRRSRRRLGGRRQGHRRDAALRASWRALVSRGSRSITGSHPTSRMRGAHSRTYGHAPRFVLVSASPDSHRSGAHRGPRRVGQRSDGDALSAPESFTAGIVSFDGVDDLPVDGDGRRRRGRCRFACSAAQPAGCRLETSSAPRTRRSTGRTRRCRRSCSSMAPVSGCGRQAQAFARRLEELGVRSTS